MALRHMAGNRYKPAGWERALDQTTCADFGACFPYPVARFLRTRRQHPAQGCREKPGGRIFSLLAYVVK